jgi:FlaA1/EpsC-like NDP-sugar epimerase
MTLAEASQLVIQAGTMSTGGDVFVLDMGEPVLIYELATRMIKLSGLTLKDAKLNPNGDIEIKIIGLRPGEKLYEELLIGNNPENTKHKKIKKACEDFIEWDILESEIKILGVALNNNDVRSAIQIMQKLVVEFEPSSDIVDFIYNQKKI